MLTKMSILHENLVVALINTLRRLRYQQISIFLLNTPSLPKYKIIYNKYLSETIYKFLDAFITLFFNLFLTIPLINFTNCFEI